MHLENKYVIMTNEMEKRDSMAKINIHALLKNQTENIEHRIETTGIRNGNQIIYQDKEIQMVLKIMENEIRMKRKQQEDCFACCFIPSLTTDGIYDIKSVNMSFPIRVYTKKLQIEGNKIVLEYEMTFSNEPPKEFYYQLIYEVIP